MRSPLPSCGGSQRVIGAEHETSRSVRPASGAPTTTGKWITHPPTRCPNGHQLGPGEVLVGHQACLGHGGAHTTWTCRTCDQTVYGAPLNTHCSARWAPAAVRLSGATRSPGGGPSLWLSKEGPSRV